MLADRFDAFFFDLDGVVYLGAEPLPGAVDALARLREMGKEVRFLTNDPTRTRSTRRDLLSDMGIDAAEAEIVTSSWATANYLAERGIETAYAIGSPGLETELEAAGVDVTDENPDAVVVGSADDITYEDIKRGSLHIHDGAWFVATNADPTYPRPEGPVPGTGAIVRAVETATDRRPTVVGKPEPEMFDVAARSLDGDGDVLMLGDTPGTDILGAHRAGYAAVLVGSEPVSYPSAADFRRPDATMATLAGLFEEREFVPWEHPGFTWPETVAPTVAPVVRDDEGRVFLARETPDEPWRLPLAQVEPGESIADSARRAVEPYDFSTALDGLAGVYSNPAQQTTERADGTIQLLTCCLRCTLEGEATTDGETATFATQDSLHVDPMHARWLSDVLSSETGIVR